MREDIVPGATFPDYELPDPNNVNRRLSEIQDDDPLILTLARGLYCPRSTCSTAISLLCTRRSLLPTPRSPRSRPIPITRAKSSRLAVGAQWPFLSDPKRIVQRDLDIQEYTDPDTTRWSRTRWYSSPA